MRSARRGSVTPAGALTPPDLPLVCWGRSPRCWLPRIVRLAGSGAPGRVPAAIKVSVDAVPPGKPSLRVPCLGRAPSETALSRRAGTWVYPLAMGSRPDGRAESGAPAVGGTAAACAQALDAGLESILGLSTAGMSMNSMAWCELAELAARGSSQRVRGRADAKAGTHGCQPLLHRRSLHE